MDLSQLETEINKMKADTLSMYGNKIELTRQYIKKEKRLIDRKEKNFRINFRRIFKTIKTNIKSCKNWKINLSMNIKNREKLSDYTTTLLSINTLIKTINYSSTNSMYNA